MVIFIVLWPYLLTTLLRCLQKNNIGHTVEGGAIDEAAEAVQDLAEFNKPPDSKEAIEKQVKENLETFLEDVDIQR